jgi:carboxyl-terminal processing protease
MVASVNRGRTLLALLLLCACGKKSAAVASADAGAAITVPAVEATSADAPVETEEPSFAMPTGALPSLRCDEVHTLVRQVRSNLPYEPAPVQAAAFAERAALWIDALGLLTGDGKSRFAKRVQAESAGLLRDLENPRSSCEHATTLAKSTALFVDELRQIRSDAVTSAAEAPEQSPLPLEGSSESRIRTLRERERALPDVLRPYARETLGRALPVLSEEAWRNIILAGAFRAWLPMVDAHSEWAPAGEEASIYDVDLDDVASGKLFSHAIPTLVGVRLDRAPAPPLELGDVVLRAQGLTLGGLPPEQLIQVSVAALSTPNAIVQVYRAGKILDLDIARSSAPKAASAVETTWLQTPSGREAVGVLAVQDVHDRLGSDVAELIREARSRKNVVGLVLDLRGNGGGSMDGALDALGHFLPGLPMFPLKSRNESVLPDMAPTPPSEEQWDGPVAALVDSDTASAAEMLAGALLAYKRGTVIGNRTFGKGCVQEYLDDEAQKGLLRLTTFLYALPDGHAVQRVGITPSVSFSFGITQETEASTKNVPPKWTGPDVRPKPIALYPGWPKLDGPLSACKSPLQCEALDALTKPRRALRK